MHSGMGLVFVHPPRMAAIPITGGDISDATCEINAGCFALDNGNDHNRPVLEYEQWILETLPLVEGFHTGGRVEVDHAKVILCMALEGEFMDIQGLKSKDWDRHLKAASRAQGPFSRSQRVQTINTGESILYFGQMIC